jgi:hypothetical protein
MEAEEFRVGFSKLNDDLRQLVDEAKAAAWTCCGKSLAVMPPSPAALSLC